MDVKALQARIAAFAAERGWDEVQNPRNLALAIAGEAGMLLDLFRWLTDAQSQRIQSEYKREAAEEAIADLILHTLRLADKLGVDVERAVAKKLAENESNYPPPASAPPADAEAPKPAAAAQGPKQDEAPQPAAASAARNPAPVAEAKPVDAPSRVPEQIPVAAPKPPVPKADPTPAAQPAPPPVKPAPAPAEEPPRERLPTWLDGIMPARAGSGRKKQAAVKAAEPPPEPPKARVSAPPASAKTPEIAPPAASARAPVVERGDAAPSRTEPPAPAPAAAANPPSAPLRERYPALDTDAAKVLAKSLAKRVDGARSDDPLLRELHDEVETLRRTLYSPTPKRSWIGDSLKTIRALLEEAATHEVGQAIRAHEFIAQVERILQP